MPTCIRASASIVAVMATLLAATVLPARAQSRATTADLTGTVFDQSKAVLPGTLVTATNNETGLVRTVSTGADGRFVMQAMPVGRYVVKAELSGFEAETVDPVVLTLGATMKLELSLRIAGTQEQVTVFAASPVVDMEKTVVSTVVSQQQIESLPINGRNFISFSVITPGAYIDRTPQQGASGTSGISFMGQRARSNNITVDGLDNNDLTVGSVRATFSQEAVREFQVLTNSYSAEFGKASGGVVNIVTKSGTNNVRGNVFAFFRDKALNAKGHFEQFDPGGHAVNAEKAPYSQKQFGGTVGGPLKKDKSFYFLSVERLDIAASNFVTIDTTTTVLNPLAPSIVLGTPAQILRAKGFPFDTGNVPYNVRSTQLLAKVDQQMTSGSSLSVRFNAAKDLNENIEPFGGLVAKSRAAKLDSKDNMFAAGHTAVVSTRTVNELRFQVATRKQKVLSLDPTCSGECDQNDEGGPTVEVLGFASAGRQRFTPQPRENTRYQFLDTVSYYVGNHQVKAGVDFSYVNNKNQSLPLHFGGRYVFAPLSPAQTGLPVPLSAIQALALDIPGAYVQGYGDPSMPYKYRDVSLFAQDDWRFGDRFTAKLGVRYQRQYWPNITYKVTGYPGSYTFPEDTNNVAPRLGFAFDPAGDKRTSVHGSYGIFFDNLISGVAGITEGINGSTGVRTLAVRGASARTAWLAPGRRLPEAVVGTFPSLVISIDPGLKTPYAHHTSVGIDRELANQLSLSANFVFVRGFKQLGTIDYNPVDASLGAIPGVGFVRRPGDVGGVPGTSASVLQYTSFGETWYRGLTVAVNRRFSDKYQFLASYTLSKAEDNSTDFQSAFIPQNNGRGRDPNDLKGLSIGFDPLDEKGPSLQDQRHRFVLSGLYVFPFEIQTSAILTVASGRPYNVLAGVDLNNDADGGTIPGPDRARTNPADPSTALGRNDAKLPSEATLDLRVTKRISLGRNVSVDGVFEVFNLFNRTNYTDVNNIAGPGAFPSQALATFGQFTQAAAPRQAQLAFKINF